MQHRRINQSSAYSLREALSMEYNSRGYFLLPAGVAELADARNLKSSRKKNGLFPLSPIVPATY
jgi:hypothetical protein